MKNILGRKINMKKICFFFGHYGPSLHVIMNYYEKIFPKDVELFVVCATKIDKEKYHFSRMKVFEILEKKAIVPFKLREFLKKNKINLIVGIGAGDAKMLVVLITATIFTKIKTAFYSLGNPVMNSKNYPFLFLQFFIDRFLYCCKEISDRFKKFLFLSRKKQFYLPCPIDVQTFKPQEKDKLRSQLGFKKEDKILFYVGRIEVEQGSDYLLELIKKNPDKKFLLIGEIKDKNFENLKLKNLVHIPYVFNRELPSYYNISDLTLFFSKRNSYPYPPRESLACGIPVIVFDLDTYGQLNTPTVKKVPFDVEKIQKEIEHFFLLPAKEKEKLSKEGRKFVIEDSSEEKIKGITVDYFMDLLKKSNKK
jgi:glycosyltransferase involved in cell wall biosynthesis